MTTRFPNGITTVKKTNPLGEFGLPDPTGWHVFFDDFDRFVAGDWTITTTEAGAGSASEVLADEDGGVLLLTNAAGDNDRDFLQKDGESFLFEAGKKLIFKARFKVSDATESDFVMGLQITDTTPLAVTDGVFFQKDDGDTNLDFHVEKDNTQSSLAGAATVADDTYIETAFFYDGVDGVAVWINGAQVGTVAITNLPDDEALTVSFGIQNGAAAVKSMSIDYIFVAKQR